MRLPRWAARSAGRRRPSRLARRHGSRKHRQRRPQRWSKRPCLLLGSSRPRAQLPLQSLSALPALRHPIMRKTPLRLKNRQPHLRLLLQRSLPHLRPCRRRKLPRLPHFQPSLPKLKRSSKKQKLRLLRLLRRSPPSPRRLNRRWKPRLLRERNLPRPQLRLQKRLPRCLKSSQRHNRRLPNPLRPPRRHLFSTSFSPSSVQTARPCRPPRCFRRREA